MNRFSHFIIALAVFAGSAVHAINSKSYFEHYKTAENWISSVNNKGYSEFSYLFSDNTNRLSAPIDWGNHEILIVPSKELAITGQPLPSVMITCAIGFVAVMVAKKFKS